MVRSGLRTLAVGRDEADDRAMTMQITVGFDRSVTSTSAVMWAADEAVARGVPLRVVSCVEIPILGDAMFGGPAVETFTAVREASDAALADLARMLATTYPGLTVTTASPGDRVAGALLQGLDADDLVVVGASRHDGLAALVLGSTTRQVLHDSPCPVVVVRGATGSNRPDRLVVGVDGSEASDAALRWAGDEADRHGVPLLVVHGWSYPYAPDDARSAQARELTEIDAACTLDRCLETARSRCGVAVSGALVERGPVSALVETVCDGDLLVLGSRGRGALRSRLFGSTVNRVLDTCVAATVVVHAPHADADHRATTAATTRR
jgi:nucleotide-binding universal stress UspA family protein